MQKIREEKVSNKEDDECFKYALCIFISAILFVIAYVSTSINLLVVLCCVSSLLSLYGGLGLLALKFIK